MNSNAITTQAPGPCDEEIDEATASRAKHLQWCKDRALEYVRMGDMSQAFASMGSDLNKHEGTRNHMGIELGMMMLMGGHLNSAHEMENFINGFN